MPTKQAMDEYLSMTDDEIANAPVSEDNVDGVPVIDITGLLSAEEVTMDTPGVKEIVSACSEWGFFQITGHGIGSAVFEKVVSEGEKFFALDSDIKKKIKRSESNSKGFFDDELTKQKLDWKQCFEFGVQNGKMDASGVDGQNQWLDDEVLPDFKETQKAYFVLVRSIALQLLSAMAVGIGVAPDHYEEAFEEDSSFIRLNYYPKCPTPEKFWSISHHTDAGAITVLYQTMVKSLQVFNISRKKWYEVEPLPDTFVINTGDIMQVWSNDKYTAPLHRVKAQAEQSRISIPLFLNPSYETNYEPSAPTKENPAVYKPINWGKFRMARFQGDYKDVGPDNQIAAYRHDRD
eukprot:TRINITY_DN5629_c1_g1_i1.p1 TRINITY_DN5629_c1_g1~~TRINITY_DN5629_c1_g1_i1.p1  ORF type:complete len:348 (+),score=71.24 TRINITY_DN5629_c1_g1_i1:54-1097(+)